ncbi:hypothetical protein GW643_17180 [Serratia marcescens]|uniref:MrpH family fimbial adhesin n=1 Tax=Serratia marcescens TaxID=615 RepID=UPI001378020E|nr:hypothetical protein [Serratia marcescens]NCJ12106.1 hypothetical protein [Serratia marcescens]
MGKDVYPLSLKISVTHQQWAWLWILLSYLVLMEVGGGVILPPPDPNFSCSMQEKIELNHGSISLEEVRGHRVSENVNIQCTGKGSVRLSFDLSKINLEPKGLLISSLYLNGSSGGLNLVVDKSENVSVESQLNIIDGASVNGEFIGNAVLIMTVL